GLRLPSLTLPARQEAAARWYLPSLAFPGPGTLLSERGLILQPAAFVLIPSEPPCDLLSSRFSSSPYLPGRPTRRPPRSGRPSTPSRSSAGRARFRRNSRLRRACSRSSRAQAITPSPV